MPKEQVTMFDNEVTEAADDFIEAFKGHKGAADRLDCTRKHLAGLLKKHGLGDKQFFRHDGKIITMKEGVVKDDTVTLKDDKEV